jgi:hypothetical protein
MQSLLLSWQDSTKRPLAMITMVEGPAVAGERNELTQASSTAVVHIYAAG